MSFRNPRRLPLVVGLAVVVIAAMVGASIAAAARSRSRVDAWVTDQAEVVGAVVKDVVDGVIADLEAVAAFVEQRDPSADEFVQFTDRIGGTRNAVGVASVGIVPADEADEHVAQMRESFGDFYDLQAMNGEGGLDPLDRLGRDTFYPVQRFAVGELIRPFIEDVPVSELAIGLDGGFDAVWRAEVAAAATSEGPTVSDFLTVELDVITLEGVFFASVPVYDEDGEVCGLIAAPLLEPLLLADIEDRVLADVEWEVIPSHADPVRLAASDATVFPLEMPGSTWSLAIAPTADARGELAGTPAWIVGLGVGLLAALLGLVVVQMLDRRAERRHADQLRRVADDKDRFLATVSHELRTPLTALSGIAQELRDRPHDFSGDEQHGLLGVLVEQSDELAGIVEDLLIAARSDIGKVVIHRRTIDLGEETRRAVETAGVNPIFEGQPGLAWADGQRVRQIMRNLLTNARRYGGSAVRVEFSGGPGWVQAVVADNGDGVPLAERSRIFESYTSAHRPVRSVDSVGLGLFISRNLARAMGGDLDYRYDGEWSHFRFRLPASSEAAGTSPLSEEVSAVA